MTKRFYDPKTPGSPRLDGANAKLKPPSNGSMGKDNAPLTLYVDRGGTSTKVWGDIRPQMPKIFPTDLPRLIPKLKKLITTLSEKPQTAIIGSRGIWTKQERLTLQQKLKFLARQVIVMSDIELAHHLCFGSGPGIVVNAGTGSIAFGRNEKGKTARAGGFGPLIGDEGSAFWIGREYLKALKSVDEIRTMIKNKDGVRMIAALAETVLRINSTCAVNIKKEAIQHLNLLITNLQSILKCKKPTPLALRGGLFNNKNFKKMFLKSLRHFKPVA